MIPVESPPLGRNPWRRSFLAMEYALQARSGQYPASQWEVYCWENHRNQWRMVSLALRLITGPRAMLWYYHIYIYYHPLGVWNLSLCSVTFGSMIIAIIFHQGVKTTKLFQRSFGMFRRFLCQTVSPGAFMFMIYEHFHAQYPAVLDKFRFYSIWGISVNFKDCGDRSSPSGRNGMNVGGLYVIPKRFP